MIPVKDSQMRTPLRRVRGLGAGHSGTATFWHQRLTSIAGVPLTIAVLIIAVALLGRNHAAAVQILGSPLVAIIMLLFILNTAYHMWIGLQEIIIDYVHEEKLKLLCVVGNTFFVFVTGFAAAFAILKLSFGV
jgi:succinate dehydrogenase / fumarate reductase, membrane anchor subunit